MPKQFLTIPDFAAEASVSRATIYRMIEKDEIRRVKFGGATRIPYSEFDRLAKTKQGVKQGVNAE